MSKEEMWLIWSIEHRAWLNPDHSGYTRKLRDAGRYSFAEARQIVSDANFEQDEPSEAMIAESDL